MTTMENGVLTLRTNLAESPYTKAIHDGRVSSGIVTLDLCGPNPAQGASRTCCAAACMIAASWRSSPTFRPNATTSHGCCFPRPCRAGFNTIAPGSTASWAI
jgi:hypothetical protein